MALYTPKKVVLNWFKYNVSFSIKLIESFVEGIEKQAENSTNRYREQKKTYVVEENPKENYARVVEAHQGLDDETWDIESIFMEYFPSLQRRSALLTVYGYFEHELDKLCLLYQSEKLFRLNLSDLNGKGVERSINYLEKVAGIDASKKSKEWNHIKRIQKIRNVIAHQDGKLNDHQGNPRKEVIDYINQMDSLSGDIEVILHKGFLNHVVSTFNDYFRLLGKSIENRTK
jgi:hypothetical protein